MGLRLGSWGDESSQVALENGKGVLSHLLLKACLGFVERLAYTLKPWRAAGKVAWMGPDFLSGKGCQKDPLPFYV